jgi:hypothetical protein
MRITLVNALCGIPVVAFYFPEQFSVHHHTGAARFVVLQADEFTITEFCFPVGQMLRNDVRMNINRKKTRGTAHATCKNRHLIKFAVL